MTELGELGLLMEDTIDLLIFKCDVFEWCGFSWDSWFFVKNESHSLDWSITGEVWNKEYILEWVRSLSLSNLG